MYLHVYIYYLLCTHIHNTTTGILYTYRDMYVSTPVGLYIYMYKYMNCTLNEPGIYSPNRRMELLIKLLVSVRLVLS